MSLKILEIDDKELPIDVLDVEVPDENEMEEMELPEGFPGEELKEHTEAISNLTSISLNLAMEGIDQTTARGLDSYIPGFYQRNGAGRTFTPNRSIEGLTPALEAVAEEKKSAFARFIEWLKARIQTAIDWVKGLAAKYQERNNSMKSVNDFLANNRKDQVYDLLNFGNKTPEEAATQFVAKLRIGGDNLEVIKSGVAERFTKVAQDVERLRSNELNKKAYDFVLSGSPSISYTHLSQFRMDLQSIMKLCTESIKSSVVGSTMNESRLSELTQMVENFKSTHAMTLSALDQIKSIKTDHYSPRDIKNNLERVNTTYNADAVEDIKNALGSLTTTMSLLSYRDKQAADINNVTVDSVKPVADAVAFLVKFIDMLNQISSASAVIAGRLVHAVSSYTAAVAYVYEAADEDSKKNIESFAKVNGINLTQKQ